MHPGRFKFPLGLVVDQRVHSKSDKEVGLKRCVARPPQPTSLRRETARVLGILIYSVGQVRSCCAVRNQQVPDAKLNNPNVSLPGWQPRALQVTCGFLDRNLSTKILTYFRTKYGSGLSMPIYFLQTGHHETDRSTSNLEAILLISPASEPRRSQTSSQNHLF